MKAMEEGQVDVVTDGEQKPKETEREFEEEKGDEKGKKMRRRKKL